MENTGKDTTTTTPSTGTTRGDESKIEPAVAAVEHTGTVASEPPSATTAPVPTPVPVANQEQAREIALQQLKLCVHGFGSDPLWRGSAGGFHQSDMGGAAGSGPARGCQPAAGKPLFGPSRASRSDQGFWCFVLVSPRV